MKTVQLEAALRENTGKAHAKKLREQGKIPAIMYGGEKEVHIVVEKKELDKIVFTPERYFIKLNIDGEIHNTIIQEHQFHPVTDHIVHIDFMEFSGKEPIVMKIPIRTHGIAPGVQAGGNLFSKMRYILIRALPQDMPERIEIDISKLQINMAVHISDLPQENREYLASPEATVVAVIAAREAMLDEDLVEEESEEGEATEEGAEEGTEKEKAGGEE